MKDLYLLNYNNYANRIVKRFNNLEDYFPYVLGDVVQNINFNPGDGVAASQLINAKYAELGTPDYLIVTNVGSNEIESRWFVIESSRTRSGQYNLTLKRDTVADSLDYVLSADSYIMKGYVKPSNPLIFNSEGMQFNQVKKFEYALKDETAVPWIVGYISPDVAKDHGIVEGNIEGYYDSDYAKIEDYPFYNFVQNPGVDQDSLCVAVPTHIDHWYGISKEETLFFYGSESRTGNQNLRQFRAHPFIYTTKEGLIDATRKKWNKDTVSNKDIESMANLSNKTVYFHDKIEELRTQQGRVLKIGDKLYKVTLEEKTDQVVSANIPIGSDTDILMSEIFSDWKSTVYPESARQYPNQKFSANMLELRGSTFQLKLDLVGAIEDNINFTFDMKTSILSNDDTPYGIICMPYSGKYNVYDRKNNPEPNKLSAQSRLKIMQALGSVANLLYDIQLVPYCPIRNLRINYGHEAIFTSNIRSIPVTAKDTGNYITSILVAQKSTFSFNIPYKIKVSNVKQANETEMWRLNSPNYASSFEFNPAKFYEGKENVIEYFNVDCTYKPYSPYIHVAPNFSGLYSKDFNDSRGLICSGDFSIDRISDNWETYQYNNKNFEASFQRQIDSMELKQGFDIAGNVINGIGGTAGGALAGAVAGSVVPGIGTAVGAIAGAAAGGIDTIYNTVESAVIGRDQINAAKDQFKYQLGNIKAQPYALSKVSALNANNKLFPFLEFYSATPEEKDIFSNYLKYNGMTVMSVGRITDYIDYTQDYTYVKAQVVRFSDTLKEDYHYVQDLQRELSTGVFINAD